MARLKSHSFGMMILSVYLILVGLQGIAGLSFNGFGMILGVLALLAGILILVGR